ncbi:MAG: FliG C-terminal domain-containing protein [Candidatus Omnitrophota bacterium]
MADVQQRMKEMLKAIHQKGTAPGGVDALVNMLNQVDRQTEQHLLKTLKAQNPQLAEELSAKYFCFEDLVTLDDAVLKKALSEIHRTTLALALKGADAAIREKVFRNLSDHAVKLLKEDMEYMGPKERSLVEEAQREATKTLRRWRNVIL